MITPELHRRFSGLPGLVLGGLVAVLAAHVTTTPLAAAEMKPVGPSDGVRYSKLGRTTHRTKFLIEGGLGGVEAGLEEEAFFKAIEDREKKLETTLLMKEVSSKRIIKSILKQSKRVRKDHKGTYTKGDTENIASFLESAGLADEYVRGTRFVVESGKGDRKPAYVVYSPDGKQVDRNEVTDPEQITSVRKFLDLQEHWLKHYEE